MISRIQGSPHLPLIQQPEAQPPDPPKTGKGGLPQGPASDGERTPPPPQRANPNSEIRFQAEALAVDLNAKLDTIENDKPKPTSADPFSMSDLIVSSLKHENDTQAESLVITQDHREVKIKEALISGVVDGKKLETDDGK